MGLEAGLENWEGLLSLCLGGGSSRAWELPWRRLHALSRFVSGGSRERRVASWARVFDHRPNGTRFDSQSRYTAKLLVA